MSRTERVNVTDPPSTDASRSWPRRRAAWRPGPSCGRSDFERDFLALCAAHGLPTPSVNRTVEGLEVDACWPDRRFVIELDSVSFHATRAAMNRGRRRDLILRLAGWEPVRLTHQQVVGEAAATAAALRTLLARASGARR